MNYSSLRVAIFLSALISSSCFAQDLLPSQLQMFVSMPEVQNDLELSDEQMLIIQEQSEIMSKRTSHYGQELMAHARNGGTVEARMLTRKNFLTETKEIAERIDSQLLPHQRKRLKQIAFQHSLLKSRSVSSYLAPTLESELKLSEDQKVDIRDAADELKSEIEKETQRYIKKLRGISSKNQEKVRSLLTEEQREKADELIGQPIVFEPLQHLYQRMNQALKRKPTKLGR